MSQYAPVFDEDDAAAVLAGLHAWMTLSMNEDERAERSARSGTIAVKMLTGKRG